MDTEERLVERGGIKRAQGFRQAMEQIQRGPLRPPRGIGSTLVEQLLPKKEKLWI